MKDLTRVIRWVGQLLVLLTAIIAVAWAFGAVWFDAPFGNANRVLAGLLAIASAIALLFVRPFWRKLGIVVVLFAGVLIWWLTIKPSEDRAWQPDVARRGWADIQGDEITLHEVRNCDYRTESDYTPRWETRVVHLSKLTGIDLAINFWGSPWIAHPIASFQFADSLPIAISIETRKTVGQSYSALRGFYRQYALIYIPADERDVIRLRTSYRREEVYLYHTTASAERARAIFLEYLKHLNRLHEHPEFYNAVTDNCTTNIRVANVVASGGEAPPCNWRILLNGKGDELLYERGFIDRNLPFCELKARTLITARTRASDSTAEFSHLIRVGLPLFDTNFRRSSDIDGYR